jgi:hypothetical protein
VSGRGREEDEDITKVKKLFRYVMQEPRRRRDIAPTHS